LGRCFHALHMIEFRQTLASQLPSIFFIMVLRAYKSVIKHVGEVFFWPIADRN